MARVDLGFSEVKDIYPQMRFVFLRLISVALDVETWYY